MLPKKKLLFPITIIILLILLFLGVSTSFADPPDRVELPDVLKKRTDLPVRSIPVVSPNPGHRPGRAPGGAKCDKDIDLNGVIKGVASVAALNTDICTNADIDTYSSGGNTYVVLAGGEEAAWTHIDVTNPSAPSIAGQFTWARSGKGTYTPDVKTFKQGSNNYIALALERTKVTNPGGVVIVNVNNPSNPVIESQTTGSDWVDVHNIFVEDDASGDGAYIYATADNSADLRVLDISSAGSVSAPAEVGRYFRNTRGFGGSGFYDDIYVHDVTVENGKVYVSYWLAGLDIFDASLVKGGTINETNPGVANIDPVDFASSNPFLMHHAYPSADGSLVAFQDEIEFASGAEVVQLWSASGTYTDGLAQGADVPVIPSHNVDINAAIDGSRMYVGWYQGGLQSWTFDANGFIRDGAQPRTASRYHQVQTEANDEPYSGAWGVRTVDIGGTVYVFQSDRNYGLIVDCVGC